MPNCIIVREDGICVEQFWYALSLMCHYKSDEVTFTVCNIQVCVLNCEPERDQNVLKMWVCTQVMPQMTPFVVRVFSWKAQDDVYDIISGFDSFTLSYRRNQENICGHSINFCREVEIKIILNTGYGEAEQAGHRFLFSTVLSEKMLCLSNPHQQGNRVSLSDSALNRAAWRSPSFRMKKASTCISTSHLNSVSPENLTHTKCMIAL